MPLSALPSHGRSDAGVGNTPLAASAATWETWDSPADVQIPAAGDFTSQGEIIPESSGSWYDRMNGAFNPVGVHKSGTTLYFFVVGADGNRSSDGGPAHRKLGYFTSSDGGATWSEGAGSPVVSHSPNNDEEEGIFGGGTWTDGATIHAMLGAMTGQSGSVDGSGDYYTTADAESWTKQLENVIDPDNAGHPGSDECFPWASYEYGGTKHVFYQAKGSDVNNWSIIVASGSTWDNLTNFTNLDGRGGSGPFDFGPKGGGDVIKKSPTTYILPIREDSVGGGERFRLYTFDPSDPHSFGSYTEVFNESDSALVGANLSGSEGAGQYCLYLDRDLGEWLLFHNSGADTSLGIKLWTAPMTTV